MGRRYRLATTIAEFYHIDVDPDSPNWPEEKLLGYLANIPRLTAKRLRESLITGPVGMTPELAHELVLEETGSRHEAEDAAGEVLLSQMRAKRKPAV